MPPSACLQVVWVGRDEVKCRLSHAPIEATIQRQHLSSRTDMQSANLRDCIQRDQVRSLWCIRRGGAAGYG